MIVRITGTLVNLDTDANSVVLELDNVAYEIMVPGYAVSDLSEQLNRTVTLHCLQYFEGSATGGNLFPRLVGFPQPGDKLFFQRFISVKGIGIRKALRALARPLCDIAVGIESADTQMLSTLPEIGKRTAQQIIAELKGKMEDFALGGATLSMTSKKPLTDIEREALEILLQLGERRSDAEELISRAAATFDEIKSTDTLVQAVYKLKSGVV